MELSQGKMNKMLTAENSKKAQLLAKKILILIFFFVFQQTNFKEVSTLKNSHS